MVKRVAAVALLGVLVSLGLAGCNGGPEENPSPIGEGLGRLRVDVRRDGDRGAIRFSFVLRSVGIGPSDPAYRMVCEPSAAEPPEGIPARDWGPINVLQYDLPPGLYALDIYGVGACYRNEKILVKKGEQNGFRAQLEPGGSVSGIVVGTSGVPLPGVFVWRPLDRGFGQDSKDWDAEKSTEASGVSRTDDNGRYFLPNLPPGEHLIVYYNKELGSLDKTLTVIDGKRLELNPVTLEKKPK